MKDDCFYAHSANAAGAWHRLSEHLESVGRQARTFAGAAPWREEAGLAGGQHDLGKYGDRFRRRLLGQDSGLDHWSMGAWLALKQHQAIAAALAIQGHHIGLQQGGPDGLMGLDPARLARQHPLGLALSDPDLERLVARAGADGLEFKPPGTKAVTSWEKAVAAMLDVRMLFSCLVDADFLDTEAHFDGTAAGKCPRAPGPTLDPQAALNALDRYMRDGIRPGTQAQPAVRAAREALWLACTHAAEAATGCFTLTAPTGSGKTLAMLKFALEQAHRHGLRRVVLAVPFLTIIEQTARVYRAVFADFPEHFVLEHHSLAGLGAETAQADAQPPQERERRLLAENWDAPIVITTNVQLLESLFSNRPSACRKLHNLMESVILFDEAQSLPVQLAVPTLAALSHLSAAYRTSVVFATATQPAFDSLHEAVSKHAAPGWQPVEAAPDHPALFAALKRVAVTWPAPGEKRTWDELADELQDIPQALVVVNLKRHALALLEALGEAPDIVHLSTNLCPVHRRAVLQRVRTRLAEGAPCRLVSTQCVEAGVDLDFPRVLRAFAPLEAIAQAAGRCNREGRLSHPGEVLVFDPDEPGDWRRRYPTHAYFQAAEVTRRMLLDKGTLDINNPAAFRDYYRQLYDLSQPASQNPTFDSAINARDFPQIARLYRLIEQDAIQVLVPWAERLDEYEALRAEAEADGIGGAWMRGAQGLAVSVYRPRPDHPAWSILIPAKLRRTSRADRQQDEWFILEDPHGAHYDERLGLILPQAEPVLIG
ncbi:CRISPR-associated endonuclease Cas3'' [Candidatus Thiodictyon syntrophicum]|jgi:CRISPR-associated helicase Cas3/CRISPR-associated endonuclease Cas3-HD|uniref:CRISPR-associated endonuclease Cas3 n=1 Tax=Candidatus Thiodictyon syntrophicum TaxID=1166950 RepID=A0A2K8UBE5_9GAMM|nr:CRISPR-associated endonuclease Cas3'' [Candidatus Thiodictyon syntrophicum]AUB82865.1 CRISPR-associated endonuclease Cas3'' [Candidatus Thiodictyon syntrophicum]